MSIHELMLSVQRLLGRTLKDARTPKEGTAWLRAQPRPPQPGPNG